MRHSTVSAWLREGRVAVRSWARAPLFAVLTTLTLGAGVAALMSVFVLVNGVLLRPLPYPAADRLVVLQNARRDRADREPYVSPPPARAWQDAARSIEDLTL
jgi:hypothetical protein